MVRVVEPAGEVAVGDGGGVGVLLEVADGVGVWVGVLLEVADGVGVEVGVWLGVGDGVKVDVGVGVRVGHSEAKRCPWMELLLLSLPLLPLLCQTTT